MVGTYAPTGLITLAVLLAGCASPSGWREERSPEGVLWRADSGPWRAEVEPTRGRLTFLGRAGGANLLNRPPGPPSDLEFGGHRVWLGPQKEWKSLWPPPANWEMRPAARVARRPGGRLEVISPASADAPPLTRTYRWEKTGLLACEVSWRETSPSGRQVITIFQIAADGEAEARAQPSAKAPRGFVLLPAGTRTAPELVFSLPQGIKQNGALVRVRLGGEEVKLGFAPQTLVARWPDAELLVHPGRSSGLFSGDPDAGFRSQVYRGSKLWPVLELEQTTPRLRAPFPGFRPRQTVWVELRTPSRPPCKDLR